MKRLSRHTVVVLLVALASSLGGMSLAVVAFGQSQTNPDATVPTGDYTATTPTPTSSYTTTSTTPATVITPTTTTKPTQTGQSAPVTTNGTKPTTTHGTTTVPGGGTSTLPSKATRNGPTHLAFTGGEPILLGAFGVSLMLLGFALHRRRRARPPLA
jgi:cytoskeletal protein RodZ